MVQRSVRGVDVPIFQIKPTTVNNHAVVVVPPTTLENWHMDSAHTPFNHDDGNLLYGVIPHKFVFLPFLSLQISFVIVLVYCNRQLNLERVFLALINVSSFYFFKQSHNQSVKACILILNNWQSPNKYIICFQIKFYAII